MTPPAAVIDELLPGGAARSLLLRRHQVLRLEARGTDANVSLLAFAAGRPVERLCVPDTLKAQMLACIRPPMVLMSDAGRALLTLTGSSLDWHDALCGFGSDRHVAAREGAHEYATARNGYVRSARTGLLDELAKHGLGERDLHAPVNLFSKAALDEQARMDFAAGHANAADWVTLRADQDVLVVLSAAPHPLDPSTAWPPSDVWLQVSAGAPPGPDDAARRFRDESARALTEAGAT